MVAMVNWCNALRLSTNCHSEQSEKSQLSCLANAVGMLCFTQHDWLAI